MHRPDRRRLLLQGLGLLCYLVGLVVFLFVVVSAYLAAPDEPFAGLTTGQLLSLAGGVFLIVGGRLISWKFGGKHVLRRGAGGPLLGGQPDKSRLEELGYHIPPDENERPDSSFAFENGEVYVVCTECGTKNDSEFDFCRECSAELPD